MDIYKVLKWAEKVEMKMAMLYARFSRVFENDEEAAFVFRKMSYDEESHGSWSSLNSSWCWETGASSRMWTSNLRKSRMCWQS